MILRPAVRRKTEVVLFLLVAACTLGNALPKSWRTLNTDFPNYYLTARLAREHVNAARAYEWLWIQREKDHHDIDQRIVGLVPITPFSTLMLWPIAKLPALQAKHVWIVVNLLLLAVTIPLLAKCSGLTSTQAGILCALSYPLQRNLLYGQFYILLLAALAASLRALQLRRNTFTGLLLGFAVALKLYPLILVFHLARVRNWRAILFCFGTVIASVTISVAVFGPELHRTYFTQVLPSALRGEALPPFNLHSGSLSTVLHRLFVYEPQWNPHPALRAPWLIALLHPLLQLAVVGPIIFLIRSRPRRRRAESLQWSSLLFAALTISTIPASYQFTVLILPTAILCGHLLRTNKHLLLLTVLALYLIIGYPPPLPTLEGWGTLLCVPRLYCLAALTLISTLQLMNGKLPKLDFDQAACFAFLAAGALFSIVAGLHAQRGMSEDYLSRLPINPGDLLAANPAFADGGVAYIALGSNGYHLATTRQINARSTFASATDQLSFTAISSHLWTEETGTRSTILSHQPSDQTIDDGQAPTVSSDGTSFAFLRQINGNQELLTLRSDQAASQASQRTTSPFNVYEASAAAHQIVIISASIGSSSPAIFRVGDRGEISALNLGTARYPAVSPDGHWLVFSRLVRQNWNLFLLDLQSGHLVRLTDAACNQIQPAWNSDSKTLVYASDCGRALWFTALVQRRVVP